MYADANADANGELRHRPPQHRNGVMRQYASDVDDLPTSSDETTSHTCDCHKSDYPPWTGEVHGMSQALLSKSPKLRWFWWLVLFVCTSCGTATTILVIMEYLAAPTATSTTIRLASACGRAPVAERRVCRSTRSSCPQ